MSASLVGSEMCIRDSSSRLFVTAASALGIFSMTATGGWSRLYPQTTFETVSYTHLTLPTICSV
eukprot:15425326-Alexandrium_andersonii.AAC.1